MIDCWCKLLGQAKIFGGHYTLSNKDEFPEDPIHCTKCHDNFPVGCTCRCVSKKETRLSNKRRLENWEATASEPAKKAARESRIALKAQAEMDAEEKLVKYVIKDQAMTAAEIQAVFGIKPAILKKRVQKWGMCPDDAVLMSDKEIAGMTDIEKLFSGWRYWCDTLVMPMTETDILFRIPEQFKYNAQPWIFRDEFPVRETPVNNNIAYNRFRSGQFSLGQTLYTFHDDEHGVLCSWLLAVVKEHRMCEWDIEQQSTCAWRNDLHYFYKPHQSASVYIPDVAGDTRVALDIFLSPQFTSNGRFDTARQVLDVFLLLRFVAGCRKKVRIKYWITDYASGNERDETARLETRNTNRPKVAPRRKYVDLPRAEESRQAVAPPAEPPAAPAMRLSP